MRIRALKEKVIELLRTQELADSLVEILALPSGRVLKPLISCLCSGDVRVKWHAVTAIGQVVAAMAADDFESARVVMRRFMWMLNDESGGIGWGIPEAIAESCAAHPQIAEEYTHILVSFMREDGFYLELPELQRGLLWGVSRLAAVNPTLLLKKNVLTYLHPYLVSADPQVKAGALSAAGFLRAAQFAGECRASAHDLQPITMYTDQIFVQTTLGAIAEKALCQMRSSEIA